MGDYGKLLILMLAILLIYVAATGRGYKVIQVLTGKDAEQVAPPAGQPPGQNIPQPNPQDQRPLPDSRYS